MNIEAALRNLDNPIQSFEEDLLQRRGFVESLCRIFETASSDESTVFALYGEWGSGKTSVKNLLTKSLAGQGEKAPLPIEFNPWAFSGQDQVLEAFFSEIGKAIGRENNGKEAAEGFKKLGAYLSFGAKSVKALHLGMDLFGIPGSKLVGMVGEQLDGGSKSAKEFGEEIGTVSPTSLEQVQKELKTALAKLERPLLIILDDLDRLTPDQLLVIFQIVKLNASLPRVNYLLLMDAKTIADRLKHKELGPEFIEKIVQFELALPHVPAEELKAILKNGFETVMGKFAAQINWERWEGAWTNGCENLFTTLRRVKRFLHTLKFHAGMFASDDVIEVDPVDLFMVETIRKFEPAVHSAMPRVLWPIVCPSPVPHALWLLEHRDSKDQYGKKELNTLTELASEDIRPEIQKLLEKLFPQIGNDYQESRETEWIRDGRTCHKLFFTSYFRLGIPRDLLTKQEIKQLFDSVGDATALRSVLLKLYEKSGLNTLLCSIQCHYEKLKPPSLPVFLAELWRLDELAAKHAGIEGQSSTRELTQGLTRILLIQLTSKEDRCRVALEALTRSESIFPLARFWRAEFKTVEENPHRSDTAFDKEGLETLRKPVAESIRRAAQDGRLMSIPDLMAMLFMWRDIESKHAVDEWLAGKLKDPNAMVRILPTFVGKSTSTGIRGTTVHYSISRKLLEHFFNPIDQLEQVLSKVNHQTLPHWEKFAVEETLKRMDEKRRGVQEAEYPEFS